MSVLDSIYEAVAAAETAKYAMTPMPGGAPPMDPMAAGGGPPMPGGGGPPMPGGGPPMDPAMMGGAPPMDPAMMGGPPPDPAAAMGGLAGAGPLDPAMLSAMPGASLPPPPGGSSGGFSEDQKKFLTELVQSMRQADGGAGGGKKNIEAKVDELIGLVKALMAYNAGKEGKPPEAVPGLGAIGAPDAGVDPATKIASPLAPDVRITDDYAKIITGKAQELSRTMQQLCEQYQYRDAGHRS